KSFLTYGTGTPPRRFSRCTTARRFLVRGASARTAKWAGTRRRGPRDVATALHGTIRLPAPPPGAALHRQGRAAPARSRRRERARSGSRQSVRHIERGARKAPLSYYSIVKIGRASC